MVVSLVVHLAERTVVWLADCLAVNWAEPKAELSAERTAVRRVGSTAGSKAVDSAETRVA